MTKEKPQALALRRKLDKQLKLELTNSSPRTWGSSIYGIGVDADDLKSDGGEIFVYLFLLILYCSYVKVFSLFCFFFLIGAYQKYKKKC